MTEYYKTLGLTSDATLEDVKIAYRKLSKKFHPDVNQGDKYFEERFKEIQDAYEKIITEKTKSNNNHTTQESEEKKSENSRDFQNQQKKDSTKKNNYTTIVISVLIIILFAIIKPIFQKSINKNAKEDLIKTYQQPVDYKNESNSTNYDSKILDPSSIFNSTSYEVDNDNVTNTNNNNSENNSLDNRKPDLKESLAWVLSKLNQYTVEYTIYSQPGSYKPTHSKYYNFSYSTSDSYLIVTYNYDYYEKYVSEQTLKNYYNANMSTETAYSLSNEYRATKSYRFQEIIPLDNIEYTYYYKDKDYNGKCEFSISTKKNVITRYNLSTGEKNYSSYFKFVYDCSQEDNLGDRINDALTHIKNISPKTNSTSREPF